MKFNDIPARIRIHIRVKQTNVSSHPLNPSEQPVFSVLSCLSRPGEFEIELNDTTIFVKPVVDRDIRRLDDELACGSAILAQLANPAKDGSFELQIAFFAGKCLEMGDIEIGVDEYVDQTIAKNNFQKSKEYIYEAFFRHCCFIHGDQAFFFLTVGPAIDEVLKPEPRESRDEEMMEEADDETSQQVLATSTPKIEPTRKNSFCVTGDDIRFVATEKHIEDESIYIITSLTKRKKQFDPTLRLAKGQLKFSDWSKTGRIKFLAKAQMNRLTKDDGSYLRNWDKFGNREGELLLEHAREIGVLQYGDMKPQRDGTVSVHITQALDSALNALGKGGVETVEIVDVLPDYLENPELKFTDFTSGIEAQAKAEDFTGKQKKEQKEEGSSYCEVLDYDKDSCTLTLKIENLPESGMLILSLAGEIAQIKRRMSARGAILAGCAANPQLGPLIEEKGEIARTRPPRKSKPLTAFVCNKVFRNPPTDRQKEAVEVALSTPDIALIQGPPGTGKTTVIAAILEQLNEMVDKRRANIRGVVLLTGFQHDAVENMINRLSVNGIPVPKFGKRSGAAEDDFDAFERNLEDWCAGIAAKIRLQNPQIAEIEQEREIRNLCLQYIEVPTRMLAANLAKKIAALGVAILGEDCSRRAANLAERLSFQESLNAEFNPLLDAVRRLRVRPESFADDGPERAADALDDLKSVLEENDRDLLDRASLWLNEDGIPPFLQDLATLRKKLLIHFSAPAPYRVEKKSSEVVELVEEAIKKIKIAGFSAKDAKAAALAEFLAELESNPYGMINAVSDYSFAFAATCQQSVTKKMQKQKGITGKDADQKMEYEYVIVDEAARVSPRDLMVPMAQGKRIILVGDHRQLPHIVNDDVVKMLSEQQNEELLADESKIEHDKENWVNVSLFEYLFVNRLPVLKEQDGITRCVTLNKQYRMHRLLGDFISRNFYERFDSSEKFESGRPDSDFVHNLPGTENKPAIWLDVPTSKGKHKRSGTSWIRPAEAIAIARQLEDWMSSEEGKSLSFGVISFYKAQADYIKKQLVKDMSDSKKLRIGTVDSFQGMEFDVVFLSMVRTMQQNWKPHAVEEEKQAQSLFGHLCLYNRLNVSMSRQKKLLVVVGDSSLLQSDLAAKFIPGVVDFFKLCQTEGRVLTCR